MGQFPNLDSVYNNSKQAESRPKRAKMEWEVGTAPVATSTRRWKRSEEEPSELYLEK